jgi:hypothetical protein
MVGACDGLSHIEDEVEGLRTYEAIERIARKGRWVTKVAYDGCGFIACVGVQDVDSIDSISSVAPAVIIFTDFEDATADQAEMFFQECIDIVTIDWRSPIEPEHLTYGNYLVEIDEPGRGLPSENGLSQTC